MSDTFSVQTVTDTEKLFLWSGLSFPCISCICYDSNCRVNLWLNPARLIGKYVAFICLLLVGSAGAEGSASNTI